VTNTTFDNLVMTHTANGNQISGFVPRKTQARIVASRRGEQVEIVCITEKLTCAELGAVDRLKGWQLVSAALEPYRPGEAFTNWH
jgi:hypothetical protein